MSAMPAPSVRAGSNRAASSWPRPAGTGVPGPGAVVIALTASGSTASRGTRAMRSMRWIIQRASSVNTIVIAARISASTSGDGVPVMYGSPANTSWRIASSPTANGSVAIASAPRAPSAPDREVEPGHEVHGLDQHVGHVERLAAPQQEQAREHHPEAVQRGQREHEHEDDQQPLVHVNTTPKTNVEITSTAAARSELMISPPDGHAEQDRHQVHRARRSRARGCPGSSPSTAARPSSRRR